MHSDTRDLHVRPDPGDENTRQLTQDEVATVLASPPDWGIEIRDRDLK
jgi:hypothetical protein